MRYRVRFRYREDTGEVDTFLVETVDADARASGHNAAHQRVAAEVAGILETDAQIEERPAAMTPQRRVEPRVKARPTEETRTLPSQTHHA